MGVGYILFQFLDDANPSKGATIVNANSSLLSGSQIGYSPIDCELTSLDFAVRGTHYWIWGCPEIKLYSDCSGLLDMMNKPLADITNRRHQKILDRLQNYNFIGEHIPGVDNKIADCLSRLCRNIRQTHHYSQRMPRILPMSKRAKVYLKQVEILDPMVSQLATIAGNDLDYMEMMMNIENGTHQKDLHDASELRQMEGLLSELGTVTLPNGERLIIRNGCEVLIPKQERKHILEVLHRDHMAARTMIRQCRGRIWWPRMRNDIQELYELCKQCTENRISQPQMANEVGLADAFAHFFPGEEVNVDFAERGSRNFMVVVDILTGFMQVYETKDKTSMTAVKVLREWSASFGRPYRVRCDSGPGYRQTFIEEMGKLGVQVIHSSAYNPSSNSHAERAVRTLKDILKKHENISSLQLKEILFCSNTRLQVNGAGSPLARFLGRDVLSGLPNSLDRSLNWDQLMQIRADEHQKG